MRKLSVAFGILLVAAWAIGAWAEEPSTAGSGETREIQVTAKKYEFNPKVIDVKQGEHIKLIVTATDHDHGFECGEFHINQLLKKGQPATIEFTADKAGTFPFRCSHFCGMGHLKMKGQIIVAASQ